MINKNHHKCNLERRKTLDTQAITEAFGGSSILELVYVYNDDDSLSA